MSTITQYRLFDHDIQEIADAATTLDTLTIKTNSTATPYVLLRYVPDEEPERCFINNRGILCVHYALITDPSTINEYVFETQDEVTGVWKENFTRAVFFMNHYNLEENAGQLEIDTKEYVKQMFKECGYPIAEPEAPTEEQTN